ncbi:MAG: hypothetical protein HY812_10925 [Planctomycetes bacterium]|nr:hypothetical protein [Planctomycetota bacterium]
MLGAPPCGAQETAALEFLYIDAASGEAAGGHAALRLHETVFHYEYHPGGLLLLARDCWEEFLHDYNDRQNRSVTLTRVPVSQDSYDRVRSHFLGRYVLQERRLLCLKQLEEERALLLQLAAGEDAVALEGLGFFSQARASARAARALRSIVLCRFGDAWLAARLDAVRGELEMSPPGGPGAHDPAPLWGVRLRERLAWREALALLQDARELAGDALLTSAGNGGPLTNEERAAAEEFCRQLADSVATLLASSRPDRGTALLLQMARYQALCRSLRAGSLLTLDPFSERAERLAPAAAVAGDQGRESLLQDARAEVAALRQAFVADASLRAIAYARLEAAQGRLSELERAVRLGISARVEGGHILPCRSRAVRTRLPGTPAEFSRAARLTALSLDSCRKELAEAERYHLITQNCVTELVRDVNESFASPEQARERLGGLLEPGQRLSFIPCQLPAALAAACPWSETTSLPSYRLRQLDRLYEESGPLVWLRESNTLTSSVYSPSQASADDVFLFFTDDVATPRPLLGSANLLYASAHAVGGLLLAPLDRGELLVRSLRGMFYSLPEIVFFNVRKGSFPGAPRHGPGPRGRTTRGSAVRSPRNGATPRPWPRQRSASGRGRCPRAPD